jgi:ATP-binding cassette, subfamily B, multidrug efflux pump
MKSKKTLTKEQTRSTLLRLTPFIGKYWLALLLSIIFAAASVVLQLYAPILFGDAIDQILGVNNVNFSPMFGYLNKILIVIAVSALCTWLMNLLNNRITYKIVQDIRSKSIKHLQKLPLSYLDEHSSGDIVSRIIADADVICDGLLLGFTQIFSGVITIIMTLFFMFSKNVKVSALVVILTPLSFVVARFISRRSFSMFKKQSELRGQQTALIDEIIGNQKVVKAFGYEDRASSRFKAINEDLVNYSKRAIFYSSMTNPSTRFVNSLVYAGVALMGVLLIPGGSLTVGGLSVLLAYANQYMKPFNDISSVVTELQNALACASRVFSLLDEPEESEDAPSELGQAKGSVEVKDVAFRYVKDRPLIEDFNLNVKPGMRIAIVGPTGCGKTTLINLLMRFYDVDSGKISIDGTPIDQVSRHSLRGNYGMVLQETWLKEGTVRDNICFGNPNASEEEIIKAAKASHCWEFIQQLPNGLDTVLTDGSLSQGQKQLLCIARVMLKIPPMLILDEATSNIDTLTELQIQEAFDTLMEGRTSFVVAHRLSTIRNASLILVMKDGKIIEQGNHQELLEKGGFYSTLYNSQFQRA